MLMKIVHASGDLFGPLNQLLGGDLLAVPEEVEEGPVGAVLHDDTEDGRLDTDSSTHITYKFASSINSTHLNWTMLGWLSFLRCIMSVSYSSFTFFTATCSPLYFPMNTAP